MFEGARVTDAVDYFWSRGEIRGAVKVVRVRKPERFRWRRAVESVTSVARHLVGRDRSMIEEPIRELVVDLQDNPLRKEVVLDARRHGVDLDRGEILPARNGFDVRRHAFLTGTDLNLVNRYYRLPSDVLAPVDTAAVALVSRDLSRAYRRRAHRLLLEVPDAEGPGGLTADETRMLAAAQIDSELASRWGALCRAVMDPAA